MNNKTPNSILENYVDNNVLNTLWNLPNHKFVHWILDHAYNFSDKLHIIINESKYGINNNTIPYILFTERDIKLAKILIEEPMLSEDSKNFLNEIISCANYSSAKFSSIPFSSFKIDYIVEQTTTILRLPDLKDLDQQNIKSRFTTWLNLSVSSEAKINTLCQKEIYLSSPFSFNDRFDCQIHASDELYKNILNKSNRSVLDDEVFNLKLSINSLISKIRIACFSRKDPLHTNSLNMWGLYGDKGKGIAVSYNVADLLLWFCNYFQKGDENKSIEDVEYSLTHKPSKIIQNLIKYVFKSSEASNAMKSFYNGMAENELRNLILTKSSTWEHEEELRFSFLTDYSLVKKEFDSIKTSTKQDEVIQELIKKIKKIAICEEFIKPCQIILGWDCDKNDAGIIKLCTYCKDNAISIIKLQGCIDYENDKLI